MTECSLCGTGFDGGRYHMIYAFVSEEDTEDPETRNLCPKCTDKLIKAMRSVRWSPSSTPSSKSA